MAPKPNKALIKLLEDEVDDVQACTDLLQQLSDPNAYLQSFMPPLVFAAAQGQDELVATWVKQRSSLGIDIHSKGRNGESALLISIDNSASASVRAILDASPLDLDTLETACIMAVQAGDEEILSLLLKSANKEDNTPFTAAATLAIEMEDPATLQLLVQHCPQLLKESAVEGNSLLHHACAAGTVGCMKVLIDAGAEVNCRNSENETPLHLLAALPTLKEAAVNLMKEAGADLSLEDNTKTSVADLLEFSKEMQEQQAEADRQEKEETTEARHQKKLDKHQSQLAEVQQLLENMIVPPEVIQEITVKANINTMSKLMSMSESRITSLKGVSNRSKDILKEVMDDIRKDEEEEEETTVTSQKSSKRDAGRQRCMFIFVLIIGLSMAVSALEMFM